MEDKYPKLKELNDFLEEMQTKLKKLSEELNKQPRDFWIVGIDAYPTYQEARYQGWKDEQIIHVREVID